MSGTSNDGRQGEQSEGQPVPLEMSVKELQSRLGTGDAPLLLDVREPFEYRHANIGGLLIPLGQLPGRLTELDTAREIAVLCHHGNRSRRAAMFLRDRGYTRARNVTGGIDAWSRLVDPSVPVY